MIFTSLKRAASSSSLNMKAGNWYLTDWRLLSSSRWLSNWADDWRRWLPPDSVDGLRAMETDILSHVIAVNNSLETHGEHSHLEINKKACKTLSRKSGGMLFLVQGCYDEPQTRTYPHPLMHAHYIKSPNVSRYLLVTNLIQSNCIGLPKLSKNPQQTNIGPLAIDWVAWLLSCGIKSIYNFVASLWYSRVIFDIYDILCDNLPIVFKSIAWLFKSSVVRKSNYSVNDIEVITVA